MAAAERLEKMMLMRCTFVWTEESTMPLFKKWGWSIAASRVSPIPHERFMDHFVNKPKLLLILDHPHPLLSQAINLLDD
jgi:hypothetical protein